MRSRDAGASLRKRRGHGRRGPRLPDGASVVNPAWQDRVALRTDDGFRSGIRSFFFMRSELFVRGASPNASAERVDVDRRLVCLVEGDALDITEGDAQERRNLG